MTQKFDLGEFSEQEREALEFASHAALARGDFGAFCTFIDDSYKRAPHIDLMAHYLEQIESGRVKRLMLIMPPGHSKSETASGKFPSWFIGRNPTRRVILTSYGATLAETFSAQNRDTVAHNPMYHAVFPSLSVSTTNRSSDKWALHGARETMIAGGVGGAITGYRCHGLIIDDPVKNYEEAHSPAHQEMVYNWYKTTSRTRLFGDGWIVLIMTHWAQGDLAGRIMDSSEADDWVIVHLPALSYGTPEDYETPAEYADFPNTAFPDPLGRPKGEALWEPMFTREFLLQSKSVMKDEFEALYQGNPGIPGGSKFAKAMFHMITQESLTHLAVKPLRRVRSWDLAWSAKTDADFTVGLRATLYIMSHLEVSVPEGKVHPREAGMPHIFIVIEDLVRWQSEWPESEKGILRCALQDGRAYEVLVESVASQNSGFKALRRQPALMRHTIRNCQPVKDKVARAQYPASVGDSNMLYVLWPSPTQPPEWLELFLKELADFPHGRNDDQVDALTQMVNHWQPDIMAVVQDIVMGAYRPEPMPGSQFMRKRPAPFREGPGPLPQQDQLAWVH